MMKLVTQILHFGFYFFTITILFSCQQENESEKIEVEKTAMEIEAEKSPVGLSEAQIKDCNTYLDEYEAWADKYIPLKKQIDENPGDVEAVMQVANMSIEIAEWANAWKDRCYCAYEDDFVKRYEAISQRIEDTDN
jgi:hypothetical protein